MAQHSEYVTAQSVGDAAEGRACAPLAAALDDSPRIVTTGGNTLITGTDSSTSETQAHIDWFAFTVTPPAGETPRWLIQALIQFLPILNITPTGKGWNGYKQRHNIEGLSGGDLGLIAFGGASQRGSIHVELNAQGCALVQDWSALQAWVNRPGFRRGHLV